MISAEYSNEAAAVSRFSPNPSRRVTSATVTNAKNERRQESATPESEVHLIKRPPVLQSSAAATTKSNGETAGEDGSWLCAIRHSPVLIVDYARSARGPSEVPAKRRYSF
jgi:hypothetical protein